MRRTITRCLAPMSVILLAFAGCATSHTSDTARTGIEQLLISNAVDQALNDVDFSPLSGRSVYVQEKYLDGVDKNYILGSLRHRVLAAGARLAATEEAADAILEVRSGGVGTDRMESFVGSPQIALPLPLPVHFPEVRLVDTRTQIGTAKLALVAYDAKSREAIGAGGITMARSFDVNRYYFGAGPFNSGTVREEITARTGQGGISSEIARQIPGLNKSSTAAAQSYGVPVSFDEPSPTVPTEVASPYPFAPPSVPPGGMPAPTAAQVPPGIPPPAAGPDPVLR